MSKKNPAIILDWKEISDSGIAALNTELKKHNLMIVSYDTETDYYALDIIDVFNGTFT